MDFEDLVTKSFIRVCDELKYKKIIKNDNELSDSLGVTPQAISGLRRGKTKPSLQIIYNLHEKFNINPAFFFVENTTMFMGELKHYDAEGGEVLILQEERMNTYNEKLSDLEEQLNNSKLLISLLKDKLNKNDGE